MFKSFSLRYPLLTYRLDQLWLPAAFWALFAIMAVIFRDTDRAYEVARGLVGGVLPLLGGIMAAYSVLDDPALELQFATPIPEYKTLLERLGLTFVIVAITAITFQLFLMAIGIRLSQWVDPLVFQTAWIVPTFFFLTLGTASAFAMKNCTNGAMLVGLLWILELILRDWLAADRYLHYGMVFLALIAPTHPDLPENLLLLTGIGALLLVGGWALYKSQERYL